MRTPKAKPFTPLILGLLLTGCSFQNALTLGVHDPCASLNGIIKDYPSAFASYRGQGNTFNTVTIYAAKEQIIRGHCEIWNWASNDSAYVCSANTPNPDVAMVRYNAAVDAVEQCLSNDWQSEEKERTRNGRNAGTVTTFTTQTNGQPNVSIHRAAVRGHSAVYLYVGTPAKLAEY